MCIGVYAIAMDLFLKLLILEMNSINSKIQTFWNYNDWNFVKLQLNRQKSSFDNGLHKAHWLRNCIELNLIQIVG